MENKLIDLGSHSYLNDIISKRWPDSLYLGADGWEVGAKMTDKKYRYILHLIFSRQVEKAEKELKAHWDSVIKK